MNRSRLLGGLTLVASVVVAQLVTDRVPVVQQGASAPFVERGAMDEQVRLSYADVRVTDVRPAQYLGPPLSTDLARLAGGVWVVVSTELSATREPEVIRSAWLVDPRGREYVSSKRSQCASSPPVATGVTTYALFCFDVPTDRLAGLHLRLARGDHSVERTASDDLADVDLGLRDDEVADWPQTTAAYRSYSFSLEPVELAEITLTETGS